MPDDVAPEGALGERRRKGGDGEQSEPYSTTWRPKAP